ncbi:BPSS1780 family membrane protein [Massilia sp. PWRC2]|uniref:BPSS1780 family membrane protein n=1 Tax=Massilia sp. PWRC2 TaxID=2804626 RepID=UPI003CF48492
MSTTDGKIAAKTGWLWLKQGLALFRQQPAALTTILFANVLLVLLLHAIPLLGQFIAVLLIPSLSMALMQACLLIDHKQRVTLPVLLTGFQKPLVFTLCKIGVAHLTVVILTTLPGLLLLGDGLLTRAQLNPANISGSDALILLTCSLLQIFFIIALSFAAPLATWQKMAPAKALFYSFFAVWRSARVFVVMLLAWLGLFMLISTVPRLLLGNSTVGFVIMAWVGFIFILLLQCAMFASYRQIFGTPALTVNLAKP